MYGLIDHWQTYQITDFLMFSKDIYFLLFAGMNAKLWPIQPILWVLGVILVLDFKSTSFSCFRDLYLPSLWFFLGWFFHLKYYATIQLAAAYFAFVFFIQALILTFWLFKEIKIQSRKSESLAQHHRAIKKLGYVFFMFSLFYPLIQAGIGERTLDQSTFLATDPDALAIGTLGYILFRERPLWLGFLPLVWLLISSLTHFAMGSREFWVLIFIMLLLILCSLSSISFKSFKSSHR
jgi:hypothetical protein